MTDQQSEVKRDAHPLLSWEGAAGTSHALCPSRPGITGVGVNKKEAEDRLREVLAMADRVAALEGENKELRRVVDTLLKERDDLRREIDIIADDFKKLEGMVEGHPAAFDAVEELQKAAAKFPAFNSAHEGFAVLKEEVDELWDEVKGNGLCRRQRMREEAVQVAAMALRFIEDVCDKP